MCSAMSHSWTSLPAFVRQLPADLGIAIVYGLLTSVVVLLPVSRSTPLAVLFAVPFSLFFPGYVLVAALFPECYGATASEDGARTFGTAVFDRELNGVERLALSVVMSVVVVPLVGMTLLLVNVDLRPVPITFGIVAIIIVGALVAAYRRSTYPPADQFEVAFDVWFNRARNALRGPGTRTGLAVHVILALSLLLAAGSGAYAIVASDDDEEPYTEFYLLAENESGDLVANGYPTAFQKGESRQLAVAIANHEEQAVNYTVITRLQRVSNQTGSVDVTQQTRLDTFAVPVKNGERRIVRRQVAPTMTGDRLRLQFLLYRGEPPSAVTPETAYRRVHLWANVTAP